jgi:hypothetical protein
MLKKMPDRPAPAGLKINPAGAEKVFSFLKTLRDDEHGANMFVVISICFALILVTPIFVDFASLHYSRRTAQTGADGGAHAAAVEYALRLSYGPGPGCWGGSVWAGFCGEPAQSVVMRYLGQQVTPMAYNEGQGRGLASQYASMHRSRVVEYRNYFPSHSGYIKSVAGVPIPAIATFAKVRRPVDLIYQDLYGASFRAPAKATGEAYLWRYNHWTVPCGEYVVIHYFQFYWKVRLMRTID